MNAIIDIYDEKFKENILNKLEEFIINNIETLYIKYDLTLPFSSYCISYKGEKCLYTKDGVFITNKLYFIPTPSTKVFEILSDRYSANCLNEWRKEASEKLNEIFG